MTVNPEPTHVGAPDFMILGTPRSGTTVVQRLLADCRGISVPQETHFFSVFVPTRKWQSPPLSAADLRSHLTAYADMDISPLPGSEVDAVIESLDGRASTVFDLFAAVVRHLSGFDDIVGEKTPHHLLWWRQLATAYPSLRFIWVIRDPRAVVESNVRMPWGMDSVAANAAMWSADQRQLSASALALGKRMRLVRYEDVVANPDETRIVLAQHVGLDGSPAIEPARLEQLATARETWKDAVVSPIVRNRNELWRDKLDGRSIAIVEAICGAEMEAHGYTPTSNLATRLEMGERIQAARVRASRVRRMRQQERIVRTHLAVRVDS
ncbi:MAG: sulfotransferase [Acidimicrobiia bacterium]|nr:sulfotransferase [Acidimicrobiia bacterium]